MGLVRIESNDELKLNNMEYCIKRLALEATGGVLMTYKQIEHFGNILPYIGAIIGAVCAAANFKSGMIVMLEVFLFPIIVCIVLSIITARKVVDYKESLNEGDYALRQMAIDGEVYYTSVTVNAEEYTEAEEGGMMFLGSVEDVAGNRYTEYGNNGLFRIGYVNQFKWATDTEKTDRLRKFTEGGDKLGSKDLERMKGGSGILIFIPEKAGSRKGKAFVYPEYDEAVLPYSNFMKLRDAE